MYATPHRNPAARTPRPAPQRASHREIISNSRDVIRETALTEEGVSRLCGKAIHRVVENPLYYEEKIQLLDDDIHTSDR